MARKQQQSISNLIQEEAQKLTPNSAVDESAIEVSSVEVTEPTDLPTETSIQLELEATIKDLKTTLEKTQDTEKALQTQIKELQSALSEQQASVQRLTTELDETKQTALHLAEANSKLIEENKSAKQSQEAIVKQAKENYKPVVDYRKSHRSSEKLADMPVETKEDFAANTWLYD